MRIVFMGTPEFAQYQLKYLVEQNHHVVGVVTMPDKPMGRGLQMQESAVKSYAKSQHLTILQPEKLKAPDFIDALKALEADVFVVVAFRMLPEMVWSMPKYGTLNLHASLLPKYRGAAPINWCIIKGEHETGNTTFLISHEIDTGNILLQEKIQLEANETAGSLHDKLMLSGAPLIEKTLLGLANKTLKAIPQNELLLGDLPHAPKIFKPDCKLDFSEKALLVNQKIKGLSPYPTAFCKLLLTDGKELTVKIFSAEVTDQICTQSTFTSNGKTFFNIACADFQLSVLELQLEGKKRMDIKTFLSGFKLENVKEIK